MEIAVIGAGNMGCVYGGNLARESEKMGLKAPYSDALTKLMKGRHHEPINKTEVGN